MSLSAHSDSSTQTQNPEVQKLELVAFYDPQRVIAYVEGRGVHPNETVLSDMVTGVTVGSNQEMIINKSTDYGNNVAEITSLQGEIDELNRYIGSKEGISAEHNDLIRGVVEAKRAMVERLRLANGHPGYNAAQGHNPAQSAFAISEFFREAVAKGLKENNPYIIPYHLRIEPLHEIKNNRNPLGE